MLFGGKNEMRKIGNILLLIAGILTILGTVGYIVASIMLFVFSGPAYKDALIEGLTNGTIHSSLPGTPEQVAGEIQVIFLAFAIVCAVEVLFAIGCAVVAFLARSKQSSGLYIANIVLGVLNGSIFSIIGGILGVLPGDNAQ